MHTYIRTHAYTHTHKYTHAHAHINTRRHARARARTHTHTQNGYLVNILFALNGREAGYRLFTMSKHQYYSNVLAVSSGSAWFELRRDIGHPD